MNERNRSGLDGKIEAWQIELIEAVCDAEEVKKLKYGPRLIQYLAAHSEPGDKARKSEAIRQAVLGGAKNVGLYLKDLQIALDLYFDGGGTKHEHRIAINFSAPGQTRHPNQYALRYPLNHGIGDWTRKFWKDYLPAKLPTVIAYGMPLFKTNESHEVFTREVLINREQEISAPNMACYPFVTHGEMLAMLELTTWLMDKGVTVKHEGYTRSQTLRHFIDRYAEANGILLGTARVNGILRNYQNYPAFPFFVEDTAIVKHQGSMDGGEIARYTDKFMRNGQYYLAYVLVSRRPGQRAKSVTIIAANTGRAIERMGRLFTREDELEELFKQRPCSDWGSLPDSFQLLFEVTILDHEQVPGTYRLIDWWDETHPLGQDNQG